MPLPAGGPTGYSGSLTVDQIGTRVKRLFGDESGAQVTDADILRWVNDGQRELVINNNLLQIKGSTTLLAGQSDYSLPVGILNLRSIKYNGVKLSALTLNEADTFIDGSENLLGLPTHFWVWANTLTLYPAPDASTLSRFGNSLVIYYTRQPVALTVGTDVPELPSQYHNRLVDYCMGQAYELDDNMQAAQVKLGAFQQGADKLKDNESWNQQDLYPHITVSVDDTMAQGYDYYAGN